MRLEPLTEAHLEPLHAATPFETFVYFTNRPRDGTRGAFLEHFRAIAADTTRAQFAVIDRATGGVVGSSAYLDIRPAHRGVEIGYTWYAPSVRGTRVNPESKWLLLRHAFETLGCVRVQLKTDGRNVHSQRAIAKLGAVLEGTLRRHIVMPDGFVRDTVMFSILPEEWPAVEQGLLARLA